MDYGSVKKNRNIFVFCVIGIVGLLARECDERRPTHITVFVHGSHGTFPTLASLSSKMARVDEALFACPLGMWRIDDLELKNHFWTMADILDRADPGSFPRVHYYAFGWSGQLSFMVRHLAAHRLYGELKRLIRRQQEHDGVPPILTIITHSHGGNVALNLGFFYHLDDEPSFEVDRLILLACPVQAKTASFVTNKLFKRIYSLHSHRDTLQVMDPQGWHSVRWRVKKAIRKGSLKPLWQKAEEVCPSFFSSRHFQPQDNLSQARVRWHHTRPWGEEDVAIFPEFRTQIARLGSMLSMPRDLMHIEFLIPSLLKRIPEVLRGLDEDVYFPLAGTVDRYIPL